MRLLRFVLGLTLVLAVGGGFASAQEEDSFDGMWWNALAGIGLEIDGAEAMALQVDGQFCYVQQRFEVSGSSLLVGGTEALTLALQEGALVISQNGSPVLTLTRIESRDTICSELVEVTLDELNPVVSTQADFDALVTEVLAQAQIPAAGLALVAPGRVLWTGGYGYSNVEAAIPATADTPFMLASITKTFTATALMRAVEEGKVALDTPINDVLPFAVDNPFVEGEVITVRHLATHTAGIQDAYPLYNAMYVPGDSQIPLGDFLRGYLVEGGEWYDAEANFAERLPGVQHEYSNVGAALAGYIVEVVTAMPLDEYAQQFMFGPLGMTHTGWHLADFEDITPIAVPYSGGEAQAHFGYPTWPDGQIRTSPSDVARFLAAIMNGGELDGVRILDEATVTTMLQPALPEVDPNMAIFWFLNYPEVGYIGHSGGDPGVGTWMFFSPERELGVALLFNCDCALTESAMGVLSNVLMTNADILSGQ